MVYCGKPSSACAPCRKRRTRCNRARPACTQCVRGGRECTGYRNEVDSLFRIVNDDVIEKVKIREAIKVKAHLPQDLTSATKYRAIEAQKPWNAHEYSIDQLKSKLPTSPHPGDQSNPICSSVALVPSKCLGPTLQQRGRAYFSTCSSAWLRTYDLGDELFSQTQESQLLLASVDAIGLASFANITRRPDVMKQARLDYVNALCLTNTALRSPTEAQNDITLFSVVILGLFEVLTGNNAQSLLAWNEHVKGSTLLLKLRGPLQLKSKLGCMLFLQVMNNVLASCLQRTTPVPEHIIELRNILASSVQSPDGTWRLSIFDAIVATADLRAKIYDYELVGSAAIIREALAIDELLISVSESAPASWRATTTWAAEDDPLVWNRRIDAYDEDWKSPIWNALRTCRIFVHEVICDAHSIGPSAELRMIFGADDLVNLYQASVKIMQEMQADILASIPQRLESLYSGEDLIRMEDASGSLMAWQIHMCATMHIATIEVKVWALSCLRSIGVRHGLQQAILIADLIESNQPVGGFRKLDAKHMSSWPKGSAILRNDPESFTKKSS